MNRKFKFAIALFILFLGLFLVLDGTPFIFGDGYGYYHVGKSLVTEGIFVSQNEPAYFEYTGHAVILDNGKYITPYTAGPAVLWWPFLTIAKFFDQGTVYNDYYKAFNGHSFVDGLAILFAAVFYASIGLIMLFKLLQDLHFTKKAAYISITLVTISSFLMAYIFQEPSYSHVYEFFAVSGLLFSLVRFTKKFDRKFMIVTGAFAGLLVLIRPVDLALLVPVLIYLLMYQRKKSVLHFLLGSLPFAIIFFLYNLISYGSIFSIGYTAAGSSGFSLSTFNLLNLLFSSERGWFFWSPIMLVGLIGLLIYARRSWQARLIYIFPIILLFLVYSFWINWWAGDSEGQRFFLVLIPFVAIGLAYLLDWIRKLRGMNFENIRNRLLRFFCNFSKSKFFKRFVGLFLLVLAFYSFGIFLLYRITPTSKLDQLYPNLQQEFPTVTAGERFTPYYILKYHKDLFLNSYTPPKYLTSLAEGYNGGRSLVLLSLGFTDPIVKLERISDSQFSINIVPNNKFKNSTIEVEIKVRGENFLKLYKLVNIKTDAASKISFNCESSGCIVDYSQTEIWDATLETKDNWINLGNLEVSLNSSDKVKFVDYKLK